MIDSYVLVSPPNDLLRLCELCLASDEGDNCCGCWGSYAFQFPLPSHQCSIILTWFVIGLLVSFSSSIADARRVWFIDYCHRIPFSITVKFLTTFNDFFIHQVFIHSFDNFKSYERKDYHSIYSLVVSQPINHFKPPVFSLLIIWWRHRMTLYKVSNLFIFFFYCLSITFVFIFAFTTKVSIYANMPYIISITSIFARLIFSYYIVFFFQ